MFGVILKSFDTQVSAIDVNLLSSPLTTTAAFDTSSDSSSTNEESLDPTAVFSSDLISILTALSSHYDQSSDVLTLTSLTTEGLIVNGNAAVFGKLKVEGEIEAAGGLTRANEQIGRAIILKGDTEVKVKLEKAFKQLPVVQVTASSWVGEYRVTDKSKQGFLIQITAPISKDIVFDWIAISGDIQKFTSQSSSDTVSNNSSETKTDNNTSNPPLSTPIPDNNQSLSSPAPAPSPDSLIITESPTPDLASNSYPTPEPSFIPTSTPNPE